MKTLLIIISLLFAFVGSAFSQCGDVLVDSAIVECGSNTIYMREFKVRFNEGTINTPVPAKKYSVLLNEGVIYRFVVRNAQEFEGEVILQLRNKNEVLGSSFDVVNNIDNQSFDYTCEKTGRYQIVMSFKEGRKGCAAGVMAMVLKDTSSQLDPVAVDADRNDIIYTETRNYMQPASAVVKNGSFDVAVSHGVVQWSGKGFYIEPSELKPLDVYLTLKDKKGEVLQIDTITFQVRKPPLPNASLLNKSGGMFYKHDLWKIEKLELTYMYELLSEAIPHKIVGFSVSYKPLDHSGLNSDKEYFTLQQIRFIKSLKVGMPFYIYNIQIVSDDNKTYSLPPLGFIVH